METLVEFQADLEALPIGTVIRTVEDNIIATKVASMGYTWSFYDYMGVDAQPSSYFWTNYSAVGIEIIYLPGGHWISQSDYDTALATSAVMAGVLELLNVQGAVQWSELGFKGAPIYIDAHKILNLVLSVANTYDIKEWSTALLGESDE